MKCFEEILSKIAIVFAVLVVVSKAQKGYYWRNYIADDLPDDAVLAGTDGRGHNVYIGVTVHIGFSELPGTITADLKTISYEYGNEAFSTISNVKILCSMYPYRFRWFPHAIGDPLAAFTRNGEEFIPAGSAFGSSDRPLVVGRVVYKGIQYNTEDEVVIAKVELHRGKFAGIWDARNGQGNGFENGEVLVYDPNIPAKNISCSHIPVVINVFN